MLLTIMIPTVGTLDYRFIFAAKDAADLTSS